MTLATATPDGQPAARIVLMRNYDERGFCFYSNYASRKGLELAENARAALLFWWGALGRQVRIEGNVERLNAAESDAYYHSRPLGSRLGAWVSPQSQVIASRTILEEGLQPRPPRGGAPGVPPFLWISGRGGPPPYPPRPCYPRQHDSSWQLVRLAP